MVHKESCKKCKAAFLKALTKEFGEVTEQWKSGWPCRIDEVLSIPQITKVTARSLEKIYKALQNHRGHHDFVGQKKLPRCDYYIKSLNCIVEFDESQHFTSPRALTLSLYPRGLKLGHDRKVWLNRCKKLDRHDNDPADRDEKRAWYDTLRDILPVTFGMRPTIRIFARSLVWCENEENTINTLCKIIEKEKIMGYSQKKRSVKPIDFNKVKRNHVEKAIKEIQKDKIPKSRRARSTEIVYGGERFPVKYVLGKAYQIATKISILPDDYTGGDTSANILTKLGFKVIKNDIPWTHKQKGYKIKIIRVFLKGSYDSGLNQNTNPEFNEWVSKHGDMSPERMDAIFSELTDHKISINNSILVFPACTLVLKKQNEKNCWNSYFKNKSKNSTIVMGILDKIENRTGEEYSAFWHYGKKITKLDPSEPQKKLPVGDGFVYISSHITNLLNENHRNFDKPGKYCLDIGHGAYTGRYGNTLKKISREKKISIILTSWHKSTPSFSWIFKDGEKQECKIESIKTEYGDTIDIIKGSIVKKLFK